MHRRLKEKIASVVDLRRIRIDLVLDVSLQDVSEDRSFVGVCSSGQPAGYGEDEHGHPRIGGVTERLLRQCFRRYGRWGGRGLREQGRAEATQKENGEREDGTADCFVLCGHKKCRNRSLLPFHASTTLREYRQFNQVVDVDILWIERENTPGFTLCFRRPAERQQR